MDEHEIRNTVKNIESLGAMTVNERLFVSGLMDEFDRLRITDKEKARKILELLQVDGPSIDLILKWEINNKLFDKIYIWNINTCK